MTENEFTYWAFLSYSQHDNAGPRPDAPAGLSWGDWLQDVLQTFPIPAAFAGQINARAEIIPARIEPLFQDQTESPDNASLSEPVRQALAHSQYLIVICSPRSAQSLHVNEAVRYFKQLGRGNRILPLVIAGEPNATDGLKPGRSPADESFVPALRYLLQPDGTLDATRRDRCPIFADARTGDDKHEILVTDDPDADTTLAIAKIQLIAGLIGVGFNGLWERELKHRFAQAQVQIREAKQQLVEARNQTHDGPNPVREGQTRAARKPAQASPSPAPRPAAREVQDPVQDQAAQDHLLALQNQVTEARNQASEAQSQLLAAQNQTREAQQQLQTIQNQVAEAQHQIQEARDQVRASASQVLAAETLAHEAHAQLEAARTEVREAQHKVLEIQNLPQDVHSQIQEAQDKARVAQSQLEEARQQGREAQNQLQAIHTQVTAAQAHSLAAEKLVQEFQGQARAALTQLEAAHSQVRETQGQLEAARQQAQDSAQQALAAQNQIQTAQTEARTAQQRVQEIQNQSRDVLTQIQFAQTKSRAARRLAKVFAVMAVLALLAAGLAWRQRNLADQTLTNQILARGAAETSVLTPGPITPDQVRLALQSVGSLWPDGHHLRSLNELAAAIPSNDISNTLTASVLIGDDRQRNQFQQQLLVRLGAINPLAAMACTIPGKIPNVPGDSDSAFALHLAVLDQWIHSDQPAALAWVRQLPIPAARERALQHIIPTLAVANPTNTLALLNDFQPTPSPRSYALLFQSWAVHDPLQALAESQSLPDPDATLLCACIAGWMEHQPEAAVAWVKSQPDSAARNQALETCIISLSQTDVPRALALTDSLPAGSWRNNVVVCLFNTWGLRDLPAATTACRQWPDALTRGLAWEGLLYWHIQQDPAAAAESVTNLPLGDYRQKALTQLCQHWASTNTPAALAWAQSLPAAAERVTALNQIVTHWTPWDPASALPFATQHPEVSGATLGSLAGAWAKTDITATTNWLTTLPEGQKKDAVLLALASGADAPAVAAQWCSQLTTTSPPPELVQSLATALTRENPTSAVAWAGRLADPARSAAFAAVAPIWAQRDLPATLAWLQTVPDAGLRLRLLASIRYDLPQLSPAAQAIAALPAGPDQSAAIQGLLASWTPADPQAAVNWLLSFPPTNPQNDQVTHLIKNWAQTEPVAVAQWLTTGPAGTASPALATAFLESAVQKYPEVAAQWTATLTDATQRQTAQVQIARQWLQTDPTAATNWLNTLDLPAALLQSLKP